MEVEEQDHGEQRADHEQRDGEARNIDWPKPAWRGKYDEAEDGIHDLAVHRAADRSGTGCPGTESVL